MCSGSPSARRWPLFDPLDKIRSASLLYVPGGTAAARPVKEAPEPSWEPLPGARSVALRLEAHRGRGSVTVPASTARFLDLSYQVAYVDGQGRTLDTRPGRYLLATYRDGAAGPTPSPWGDVIDPEADCKIQIADLARSPTGCEPGKHRRQRSLVVLPSTDRPGVNRLAYLRNARGPDRPARLVEVEAGRVPIEAAPGHEPP